jgi:acyl carrier protein
MIGRIQRLFRDSTSVEVPSVDTDLIDGGLLDSLALVVLLYDIEQEFELELPLDELEIDDFRTLAGIADFVARSRAGEDSLPA